MANSSGVSTSISNHAVLAVANGVSVLVCLLAAFLLRWLKLYKKLVYRLALYQVLSALAMASVGATQVVFINYDELSTIYRRLCTAIGFLWLYSQWTKLLFTMCVTFHLFCFAVLHKNLKKLEVLYVVTSLLVPALIAIVPLITHTYGLSPGGNACYIYANTSVAFMERLALWDGPAMLMLIAASTAMVVMVTKLTSQVCRRSKYEPITDGDQFTKALKQLLPLAAFPMLFFIFEIPVFILHIYTIQYSAPNEGIVISADICVSLWSMVSGATVIIHVSVVRIWRRKPKKLHIIDIRHACSINV